MRSIIAALTLAQILVLGTTKTGTAMTAEQLLQSCEVLLRDAKFAPDGRVRVPSDGMRCWNYMQAIQDVSVITDEEMQPLLGFCAPPNSTLMQFIRIFVEHARRNTGELHQKGASVAQDALGIAFPCR
jgi:hypothetical protein